MTNQHLDWHMQFASDHERGEFGIHVLPHDPPLPFFEQQIRFWDGANPRMDRFPVFVEAFHAADARLVCQADIREACCAEHILDFLVIGESERRQNDITHFG